MANIVSEVGDVFEIWTPSEVSAYVNLVTSHYAALAADIASNASAFTANELTAWARLASEVTTWRRGLGYFSYLTLAPVRSGERYSNQLVTWRGLFEQRAKKKPTGGEPITGPKNDTLGTLQALVKSAAIPVSVLGVVYLVYKFKR